MTWHFLINFTRQWLCITFRDRDEVPSPRRPTVHRLELPLSPVTNGTAEKETEITVPPPESPLDLLDISRYLVLKKPDEEGPDIRGGNPDALIIHATKANKNGGLPFLIIFLCLMQL